MYKLVKTCNKNNTSYVLGRYWNLLPLGSGISRAQAAPPVCAFLFPLAINSHISLTHMKYNYNKKKKKMRTATQQTRTNPHVLNMVTIYSTHARFGHVM